MRLHKDICKTCKIHPSQLSPNPIRILACVEALKDKYGLVFRGVDFFEVFYLKRETRNLGRYLINLRPRVLALVCDLPTHEIKWKHKYFFTRGFLCVKKSQAYPSHCLFTGLFCFGTSFACHVHFDVLMFNFIISAEKFGADNCRPTVRSEERYAAVLKSCPRSIITMCYSV